jgi:hypothetical protein
VFRIYIQTHPVKNLLARVVITSSSSGQQRIFKFANITVPDGKFSIKYLFPDSGIYQVIYNTGSKNNFSSLGSFKVFVPLQAASSISNPFGLSPSIIIAITIIIIIAAVAAEAYFIIIKRREKIKYNYEHFGKSMKITIKMSEVNDNLFEM